MLAVVVIVIVRMRVGMIVRMRHGSKIVFASGNAIVECGGMLAWMNAAQAYPTEAQKPIAALLRGQAGMSVLPTPISRL